MVATSITFEQALERFPKWCEPNLDTLSHKTPDDLAFLVQFEIDLWNEGDEQSEIKNRRQLNQAKSYIAWIKGA